HPQRPEEFYGITTAGSLLIYRTQDRQLKRFSYATPRLPKEYGFADLFFDQNNQLWLLGWRDLYRWNEQQQQIEAVDWPAWHAKRDSFGYYWNLIGDASERLYISAQSGGMGQLNTRTRTVDLFNYQADNPNSLKYNYSFGNFAFDVAGCLWGSGEGTFRFDLATHNFTNYPNPYLIDGQAVKLRLYPEFIPLKNGKVIAVHAPNQIVEIDPELPPEKAIKLLTATSFFPDAHVESVLTDSLGRIWASTAKGLAMIDPQGGNHHFFGEDYGLAYLGKISSTHSGDFIVATQTGYLRFNPYELITRTPRPRPIITGLQIFDQPYPQDTMISHLAGATLSYEQNFFSFSFTDLNFTAPNTTDFTYRLEGFDPQTIVDHGRGYASYTNVGGGNYVFTLTAQHRYRPSEKKSVQFKIKVIPPVYQRWWFKLLALFTVTGLLSGIYRYRVKQVRKEAALKTRFNQQLAEVEMKALRAQMNPHFLFNSLNAIKYYVQQEKPAQAANYLNRFSRLIRMILQHSGEPLVTLARELEALNLYIEMEQLRFDEQFQYTLSVDPSIDLHATLLPPLLLQPYVENAIWHGLMHKLDGPGSLDIELTAQESGINCRIRDNGIGRQRAAAARSKSAQRKKSMGMDITRRRMEMSSQLTEWNFSVDVCDLHTQDGQAAGTEVSIDISPKSKRP
ncbi:MAG: histidine kinase, partial [Bacteroidota bacterium]